MVGLFIYHYSKIYRFKILFLWLLAAYFLYSTINLGYKTYTVLFIDRVNALKYLSDPSKTTQSAISWAERIIVSPPIFLALSVTALLCLIFTIYIMHEVSPKELKSFIWFRKHIICRGKYILSTLVVLLPTFVILYWFYNELFSWSDILSKGGLILGDPTPPPPRIFFFLFLSMLIGHSLTKTKTGLSIQDKKIIRYTLTFSYASLGYFYLAVVLALISIGK